MLSFERKRSSQPSSSKSATTDAHALADVGADAGRDRDVGEGAVAIVAEERVRQALVAVGVAVVGGLGSVADRLGRGVPDAVVRDEEVEPAVLVVVEEGRPHGPQRAVLGIARREAGLRRHVLERPVPAVAVEDVRPQAGHEEVGVPVVVVVGGGDAVLVALAGDPGSLRHVLEREVAAVPEEPVVELRVRLVEARHRGAVHDVDVEPAVAVASKRAMPEIMVSGWCRWGVRLGSTTMRTPDAFSSSKTTGS